MPALQLSLKSGELMKPRLKSCLRVLKGRLWLTRAGNSDDRFMEPGDVAQMLPEEMPLLEAMNGAALLSLEIKDTGIRIY